MPPLKNIAQIYKKTITSYCMGYCRLFFLAFFVICSCPLKGQKLGTSWLYRPGVRMHYEQLLPHTTNQQATEMEVAYIVPLKGKVEVDVSKLKFRVNQHFLQAGGTYNSLDYTNQIPASNINVKLGLSGMRSGLVTGVWVYALQGQMSQTEDFDPVYTGYAGVAKVRIRGVFKQDIFGLGVIYTGRKFFPVPLLGFRRKLAKHLKLNVLLPSKVELSYHPTKSWWFLLRSGWKSRVWRDRLPELPNTLAPSGSCATAVHTTTAWRNGLDIRYRIPFKKPFWLKVNAGYDVFTSISSHCDASALNRDNNLNNLPFLQIGLQLDLGRTFIPARFFGENW